MAMAEQTCACEQSRAEVAAMIAANRGNPGALVQVLHRAQELLGYVPRDLQEEVADGLGVSLADVYGVVTFYSYFSLRSKGKNQIACCQGTACYVRGAPKVLERLEKELGIKAGDSTDDGEFSLEIVRCLGACGLAPVLTVNKDTHARMKADRVPALLGRYRKAGD